jgi:hypothetical protein
MIEETKAMDFRGRLAADAISRRVNRRTGEVLIFHQAIDIALRNI